MMQILLDKTMYPNVKLYKDRLRAYIDEYDDIRDFDLLAGSGYFLIWTQVVIDFLLIFQEVLAIIFN